MLQNSREASSLIQDVWPWTRNESIRDGQMAELERSHREKMRSITGFEAKGVDQLLLVKMSGNEFSHRLGGDADNSRHHEDVMAFSHFRSRLNVNYLDI